MKTNYEKQESEERTSYRIDAFEEKVSKIKELTGGRCTNALAELVRMVKPELERIDWLETKYAQHKNVIKGLMSLNYDL
jgi:hypothetical protein